MPALARYPGKIAPGSESDAMISTLDVIPTFLSLIGKRSPVDLDGIGVSDILFGRNKDFDASRVLFFWRDGFEEGPLGPPYGRFDVAAVKLGAIKAWFWTKSAHYNDDIEEFHDPPLLFDVMADPAESKPLDPIQHQHTIQLIKDLTKHHKETLDWTTPLALATDPKYIPCVDRLTGCRTHSEGMDEN
jgi:arylsulfatase A-like enzyme